MVEEPTHALGTALQGPEVRSGRPRELGFGARGRSRRHAEEMLYMLTSFETFDTLAGPRRKLEEVAPAILKLARAALGV